MLRTLAAVVVLLLAPCWAWADPNVPDIASMASDYRKTVEAAPKDTTLKALLARIRKAEGDGNLPAAMHLYERLVARQPNNFRSWLKLSLAWRAADKLASGGLSAAFNAYREARGAPDKIEALLVMSSILRNQLSAELQAYQSATVDLENTDGSIAAMAGNAPGPICPGATKAAGADATGAQSLACQTRRAIVDKSQGASRRMADIVRQLDEVYRDLAAKLPGLDVRDMQSSDDRVAEFTLVKSDPETIKTTFTFGNATTRSCVQFTQLLSADARIYKPYVGVEIETKDQEGREPGEPSQGTAEKPPPPPDAPATAGRGEDDSNEGETTSDGGKYAPVPAAQISISTEDNLFCFNDLKAESNYRVSFKRGMPARFGTRLGSAISGVVLNVPAFPKEVRFSSNKFILPRSGAGKIAFQTVNAQHFDLELFRITDRTLYHHIALGHIGGAGPEGGTLTDAEHADLKDHFAETMWRGSVEMPRGWAPNKLVEALLPVRAILDKRTEWLTGQIARHKYSVGEMLESGNIPLTTDSDRQAQLRGSFYASVGDFETAAKTLSNPGVYALVASNPAVCLKRNNCPTHVVQWFIDTDIGLAFYEGDEWFSVAVRSLKTGAARPGVVQLVTQGNRLLREEKTDAEGIVKFPRSLTRGIQSNALAAIMVQGGEDFSFLNFNAERLDLSKLNVDGRPLPHGIDGFVTTDRGIYEPGQTIEVLALLRDAAGSAPADPQKGIVRVETRDRTLVLKPIEAADWKLGGAKVALPLPSDARPGPARITLSLGTRDKTIVGETMIRIGPIRPDQVAVEFPKNPGWTTRLEGGKLRVSGPLSARYLFADRDQRAPGGAGNLRIEAVAHVAAADSPAPTTNCYAGFAFGRHDEKPISSTSRTFVQFTDPQGAAFLDLTDIAVPASTRPVAVSVEVTLFDATGPVGAKTLQLPIDDGKGWIGLAKVPSLHVDKSTGKVALDLVLVRSVGQDKSADEHELEVTLAREHDGYSWELRDRVMQPTRWTTPEAPQFHLTVSSADLSALPAAAGCIAAKRRKALFSGVEVGRYVLTVKDNASDRVTSARIQIGVADTDPDRLEPSIFVLATDKDTYAPGDTIEFDAATPFDGPILIGFAQGDVEQWASGSATNGSGKVRFKIPADWAGKGLYALATVFRSGAKEGANLGPDRAIGAKYIKVQGGSPRAYAASIATLNPPGGFGALTPGEELKFRVCVSKAADADCSTSGPGAAAPPGDVYAVAYVVDEGLLGLTGQSVPDPQAHFYDRRRLGVRMMDSYGRLLLSEGGDRAGRLALSNYTSDRVVALAAGPQRLVDGRTEFTFKKDLDLQNGKLAIHVVVWSQDFATSTAATVTVRSPFVVDLGVPSFLLAGDKTIVPLRVLNLDFPHDRDFAIRASSSGAPARLSFLGSDGSIAAADRTQWRLPLAQGKTKSAYLMVETQPDSRGQLQIDVDVDPVGATLPLRGHLHQWQLDVKPPRLSSVRTLSFPLQAKRTNISTLVGGLVGGNYEASGIFVTARFADSAQSLLAATAPKTATGRLPILDQIVPRAMAFFANRGKTRDPAARVEGEKLIGDILGLQVHSGAFLPYRTLSESTQAELAGTQTFFNTAAALDALALARTADYAVPLKSLSGARKFLIDALDTKDLETGCAFESLYATLVLIEFGDVDQQRVERVMSCKNPGVAERAATLAIAARFGHADTAKVLLAGLSGQQDQLTDLQGTQAGQIRLAMILSFMVEANAPKDVREAVADALIKSGDRTMAPGVAAWVARSADKASLSKLDANALQMEGNGLGALHLGADGVLESDRVSLDRLERSQTSVSVAADKAARGYVTVEGIPSKAGEPDVLAAGAIRRRIFGPAGEIDPKTTPVNIGDRLVIVLEGNREKLATIYGSKEGSEGGAPGGGQAGAPGSAQQGAAQQGANEGSNAADIDNPIILADLLPSTFSIVSDIALGKDSPQTSVSGKLAAIGDLRSTISAPDRWVGVVVPQSRQSRPTGPSTPLDFRQAYIVRVNMAGRFVWPGVSVEASTGPATSYQSEPTTLDVEARAGPAP